MIARSMRDFSVHLFSKDTLFELLANEHCSIQQVNIEHVPLYLAEYLGASGLDARTIVAEYGYTDHDYMADFAACYARCFAHYRKRCVRLHFFDRDFSEDDIRRHILQDNGNAKELSETYLGFIVARPLPGAVVGRTVLQVFEKDADCSTFCAHAYTVDFYGLPLRVERSLAFQQQDATIAACATVSVWCSFHQLADKYHTPLWNPAEITRMANVNNCGLRPVPSSGLVVEQICAAFSQAKLDVEVFDLKKSEPSDSLMLIAAYAKLGVPIILGVDVVNEVGGAEVGKHAIVVTGYHEDGNGTIDSLFVHDDGIGPFTELSIDPLKSTRTANPELEMRATGFGAMDMPVRRYKPILALIPVYSKVRIGFNQIRKWLAMLEHVLPPKPIRESGHNVLWDVSVSTTSDYKTLVRSSSVYRNEYAASFRGRILFAQHPRFIWRFLLLIGNEPIIELLADATDVTRSLPFYMAAWHCRREYFQSFLNLSIYEGDFNRRVEDARMFDLLKKSVNDADGFCWAERYMDRLWSDLPHNRDTQAS